MENGRNTMAEKKPAETVADEVLQEAEQAETDVAERDEAQGEAGDALKPGQRAEESADGEQPACDGQDDDR
jgi:hypothetical protein